MGLSGDLPVEVAGRFIRFEIPKPGQYILERNGCGQKDPLIIFINPITEPVQHSDVDHYYGPGYHNVGLIELKDEESLYISGGAIVTGRIEAKGKNIKVFGQGLLDNSGDDYSGKHLIHIDHGKNVRIEGIMLRKNSRHWTLVPRNCDQVFIENVKICGSAKFNDDGIDPVNTSNMIVDGCFIRTKDDCIAMKGMDYQRSNCENITIKNTIMWSDMCCTILLGDECQAEFMRNILIENCYVPFLSFERYPKKLLMMHCGDEMIMENIQLRNIRVEGQGQKENYIEISCEQNQYSKGSKAGVIRDIKFENIQLAGVEGAYQIVVNGDDVDANIKDIHFKQCYVVDQIIGKDSRHCLVGDHVKNLSFS
jgi:polygalacturonase